MARKRERSVPKNQSGSPIRRHLFVLMGIWVLTLLAYSNSFGGELSFDSTTVVRDDPRIQDASAQNLHAIWSTGYWFDNQDPKLYRPLATLSYLVNYSVFGEGPRPAGYHWVNFLLHAVNVGLLYCLGLVILRDDMVSAAVAGLWAVHPVLTESVTNIVGRADLLAAFGVLAGLLCHVKAVSASGGSKTRWLAGLTVATTIGIFSKESAVVLLPLLLVYDLAFGTWPRLQLPSYLAASVPIGLFLWQRWQVISRLPIVGTAFVNNPLLGAGFWSAKLTAVQVIGRYIWKIAWPWNLSCDYSFNQIPIFRGTFDNSGDWITMAAVFACVAAAWLAVAAFQRWRPVFFFVVLFFLALAPVANLAMPIGTIMAERLLYLPAAGLIGCAAWGLHRAIEHWNRRRQGVPIQPVWIVGLVCLILVARTSARNADWRNSSTLFASAAAVSSESYRTHYNLALSLFREQNNLDGAIAEGERSLRILKPLPLDREEDAGAYSNVGAFYRLKGDALQQSRQGNSAEASRLYQRSLEILLHGEAVDRTRSAKLILQNRAAGRPVTQFGVYQLYQELGEVYLRLNEPRKALQALEHGFALQANPEFLEMMSEAYTEMQDRDSAAIALMGGLVTRPDQARFASQLAALYRGEPSSCAIGPDGGLNFNCPLVHDQLCAGAARVRGMFERAGQTSQVEQVRERARPFGCPVP